MKTTNIGPGEDYLKHQVFDSLKTYEDFYESLSYNVMTLIDYILDRTEFHTTLNHNTYLLSSIGATLNSINVVLQAGRINDAYALLRKYYDSSIINIYLNLLIEEREVDLTKATKGDPSRIEKIDKWYRGEEKLKYGDMIKHISQSSHLKKITAMIQKGNRYPGIRDRCNDHVHQNSYAHFFLNSDINVGELRDKLTNQFLRDLDDLFAQHFILFFYLNDKYMAYIDEVGAVVEAEGSPDDIEAATEAVCPFVQQVFDEYIKPRRPDLANELIRATYTDLS